MQEETKETFEIQKRRGLIVWVYSLRQLKIYADSDLSIMCHAK